MDVAALSKARRHVSGEISVCVCGDGGAPTTGQALAMVSMSGSTISSQLLLFVVESTPIAKRIMRVKLKHTLGYKSYCSVRSY